MARHHALIFTRAFVLALAVAMCCTPAALAQGTGRSMDIDLSVRSAALGGASAALSWDDINHWSNPALLGYAQGVRYVHTHTRLVPGLANDVFLNSDVVQVGGGGFGLVFSGQPFDPGGVRLDYGQSQGRDENGNFTGTFGSWETVKSVGAGVSLARALESTLRLCGGRDLHVSRYGDLSLGMNWKDVVIHLAPVANGGEGRTSARDMGLHARLTPIDGFATGAGVPVRFDLAYGAAVQSYNDDAMVTFINEDLASPVTRHHRRGAAGRIAAFRLPLPHRHAVAALHRVLIEGLSPLVSLTYSDEHDKVGAGNNLTMYETDGSGYEVTFANLFTYRRGTYQDLQGQIDGDTWGWGAGFKIGALAGVRYDDAHIPQARDSGLSMVHRAQWTAWVDPIEAWRGFGHRPRRVPESI